VENASDTVFSRLRPLPVLAALLSTMLLAACADAPPPAAGPRAVSFEAQAPLRLDIASITVEPRYRAPGRAPNVEHLHPVTPESVARSWAAARIIATGSRGRAVLTVLDGSVVSEDLPKKGGLTGFFGDQLDTRLTARLKARLVVGRAGIEAGNFEEWSADVDASATRTILESASLNERDAAYAALIQSLAKNFDDALSAEVRRSMGPVLR